MNIHIRIWRTIYGYAYLDNHIYGYRSMDLEWARASQYQPGYLGRQYWPGSPAASADASLAWPADGSPTLTDRR